MPEKLKEFQGDLLSLDTNSILLKYILEGTCSILTEAQHVRLKERISGKFGIPQNEIFIVGSAKLGFSIAPNKRYSEFRDSSDIDIAIVSRELYETIWHELFDFERSGTYWEKIDEFRHYCFRGWIRPDMLPNSKTFPIAKVWWDFFQTLTNSREFGPYKIRGALYHGRHFFDSYQRICIDQCKQAIEQG